MAVNSEYWLQVITMEINKMVINVGTSRWEGDGLYNEYDDKFGFLIVRNLDTGIYT